MSQLLTARELATLALRKIGSLSINDSAADGRELEVMLQLLDLEMAELAGTQRCYWLVPDTVSISLTGGQRDYELPTVLGADAPENGIQFPISATVKTGTNTEDPIRIIHRLEWEAIPDKNTSGTPLLIFLDKLDAMTMHTWPTLGSGVTGVSIELAVQTFAPTFRDNGQEALGFRAAWQKWAMNQMAASGGDGPVRRLDTREVLHYQRQASASRARLEAYENRTHTNRPRQTPHYNGI